MTTTSAPVRRRPVIVTIAVVLVYLSGLSNALLGILVLLSRYHVDKASVLLVSLVGAAIILFALLTIAVASGLARGSRLARLLVTLYLALQLVLHVVTIVTTDSWDWAAIVQIAIELFVVVAVWAPPGRQHFVADDAGTADSPGPQPA